MDVNNSNNKVIKDEELASQDQQVEPSNADIDFDDDSLATDGAEDVEDTANSQSDTRSNSSAENLTSETKKFVSKETRHVLFLRVIVLIILFLAATGVSLCVYFVTKNGESESYKSHYEAAATKVTETFVEIATDKMSAVGSLVVAMVAHGVDHKERWPFVTLSSFQERAATVKSLSGALYVGLSPYVSEADRLQWENYTQYSEEAKWYEEGRQYQKYVGLDNLDNRPQVKTDDPDLDLTTGVASHIYDINRDESGSKAIISPTAEWYLPIWQTAPVTERSMVNQNSVSNSEAAVNALKYSEVVFEGMQYSNPGYGSDDNAFTAEIAWLLSVDKGEKTSYDGDIFTTAFFPVYDSFKKNRETVAVLRIVLYWAQYFENILPSSTLGIVFVLENGCDEPFTYQIDGATVVPLGHGDLHEPQFDDEVTYGSFKDVDNIADGTEEGLNLNFPKCPYSIRVYPSTVFVNEYKTSTPLIITFAVVFVFVFAVLMFFLYDRLVERRQMALMHRAQKTHMVVASMFPKNVRDQILNDEQEDHRGGLLGAKNRIKSIVNDMGENSGNGQGKAPIADLYPESTVLFADISGFTSWSSSREPSQVFTLLQAVYQAFDEIASARKVFKVETIGDSYVACTGVPEPQKDHAVRMCRFAWDCQVKMSQVTRDLEVQLGPDTGELSMRFGINSGPVTAGVLRGDRSRFQLFGDCVNTAARMESTGKTGQIQCSQSTADILTSMGKQHWITPRADSVHAKGKGVLQTYWVTPKTEGGGSSGSGGGSQSHSGSERTDDMLNPIGGGAAAESLLKRERQIEWITEMFRESIRDIVAMRETRTKALTAGTKPANLNSGGIPLDEICEVILLPKCDAKAAAEAKLLNIKVPNQVSLLIREFVSIIASAYKDNAFHNFEHACHVTLCVSKYLKRITSPELDDEKLNKLKDAKCIATHLHDYTHGINSDPIAIFAILFSAVIHDMDHRGCSNAQLAKEEPLMAERYKHKSLAEQNSLDIALDLFMSDRFASLRSYVFPFEEDLVHFRQVTVNAVLATDIFEPELQSLRKKRWTMAFDEKTLLKSELNDMRATIVIEHIVQAADVSHCMQHWTVYRKWNEKLFREMYLAYKAGRMGANPADFWFEGELKFFDTYIIPLAKKLRDCAVFGVSSDECLNYAIRNRNEWENCGKVVLEQIMEDYLSNEGKNMEQDESSRVEPELAVVANKTLDEWVNCGGALEPKDKQMATQIHI